MGKSRSTGEWNEGIHSPFSDKPILLKYYGAKFLAIVTHISENHALTSCQTAAEGSFLR